MKTARDIELDMVQAKKVWKTVEFIATFGALFGLQIFFGIFLVSAIGALLAYAITNGILYVNLVGLKFKLDELLKKKK